MRKERRPPKGGRYKVNCIARKKKKSPALDGAGLLSFEFRFSRFGVYVPSFHEAR
jgi:hypothetical protein